MGSKVRTRMFAHEVADIVAKRNERLFQEKAKKLARQEKIEKEIAKTEEALAKLKASS